MAYSMELYQEKSFRRGASGLTSLRRIEFDPCIRTQHRCSLYPWFQNKIHCCQQRKAYFFLYHKNLWGFSETGGSDYLPKGRKCLYG